MSLTTGSIESWRTSEASRSLIEVAEASSSID